MTLISTGLLLLGWGFISRTYSFNAADTADSESFSLLSYNVRVFNSYSHFSDKGKASSAILKFSKEFEADIKCFQEFYNYPDLHQFKTIPVFKKDNPYYVFKSSQTVRNQGFGLAIFSKYPIIHSGEIDFPHKTLNQAIFADIKINTDTFRVFNIHLQSMSINEDRLPGLKDTEENKGNMKVLFRKLKRGIELRSIQVKLLMEAINSSPHKVIVAGDLNETPYSYAYQSLSKILSNAFEEGGDGFGFTYNGKLFFLRIDNVFYDKELNLNGFKVLNTVKHSDHFPLYATFSMKKE